MLPFINPLKEVGRRRTAPGEREGKRNVDSHHWELDNPGRNQFNVRFDGKFTQTER